MHFEPWKAVGTRGWGVGGGPLLPGNDIGGRRPSKRLCWQPVPGRNRVRASSLLSFIIMNIHTHLRALLRVCGTCSFGGWGVVLVVCVCVSVSGVLYSVGVCVCVTC